MATSPDAFSVRFIPSWMPGAGFQRFAAEFKSAVGPFIAKPWNVSTSHNVAFKLISMYLEIGHQDRSRTEASMALRMLEESYKVEDKEKVALEAASNSYIAGVGRFCFIIVHDFVN
jgi:hypothetical protein